MLERFWDYSDTIAPALSILCFLPVKKLQKQDCLLIIFLIVCFLIFGFSNYLADWGTNNMFLYHFFSLFEISIVLLYGVMLFHNRKVRLFLIIALMLYFIYWRLNIWLWEPIREFNSNSAGIACLLIMVTCFLFFLSLSDKDELLYFQKLPQFWVMAGFLFYSACSIPVVMSYKYKEIFYDININSAWKIQVVANIIKFLCLSFGALCSYRYRDGLSSSDRPVC
jgi:hypothetical protein